jgi:hypothetical protein
MKSYNVQNYIRYKEDLKQVNKDNSVRFFSVCILEMILLQDFFH